MSSTPFRDAKQHTTDVDGQQPSPRLKPPKPLSISIPQQDENESDSSSSCSSSGEEKLLTPNTKNKIHHQMVKRRALNQVYKISVEHDPQAGFALHMKPLRPKSSSLANNPHPPQQATLDNDHHPQHQHDDNLSNILREEEPTSITPRHKPSVHDVHSATHHRYVGNTDDEEKRQ